ncbi:DNA topoisomerase 3-alpha [Bienertia sinuspersici]
MKCNCGNDAVIRTVRNGPNAGSKFFGCPLWPVVISTLLGISIFLRIKLIFMCDL